jgi:formate hydrogenlyase transcriptional activator
MNQSSKTRQQLLLEIEALRTSLDTVQQRLQEADGLRVKLEACQKERLQSETVLINISSRFVSLPADQIDSEVEDAQRRICEYLDLDRSTLWQTDETEPESLRLTHFYQLPGNPQAAKLMITKTLFPWINRNVLGGKTVVISKMADLPPEAGRDMENFRLYGTKSTVLVPLSVGAEPVFGLLAFAVTREERDWPETAVKGFKIIAQVFSNALARKKTDKSLQESVTRLNMATNAAGAGLWTLESDTVNVWVTPKTRELFHFTPDEALNYDRFIKAVHPEDRDRLHQVLQQALQSGEKFRCEYRIILPDGTSRWLVSIGQRHPGSAGKSHHLTGVSLDITERKRMEGEHLEHLREIQALKLRLESENIYLREEVRQLVEHADIVGQCAAMKQILAQAEQVAGTDATVLLQGETGTGKELLARAIHGMSLRKDRPMITINCAALPPTLIESELFGREKGAYTGAMTRMTGRFEIAGGSTLFLDEIGELPIDLQGKLLRVLEEGVFERLGSTKPLHVDVRIIAATNRDIEQEMKDGRFRKDLFYRLNVFPIVIPPLRERSEDIQLLARVIVKEFQKKMKKEIENIPKKTLQALQSYSWPGNVRELRNVIEHAMILSTGKTLHIDLPGRASSETVLATGNLEDMERRHIVAVLDKTGWRIAGQGGAAEILGLKRTTLQAKMKKLGIKRSNKVMPK